MSGEGGHDGCALTLTLMANDPSNSMSGLRGRMAVSDKPPMISVPEFPPMSVVCPHGHRFWTFPDKDRVAALRDLNYPPTDAEREVTQ